jgi:hypothetical protein
VKKALASLAATPNKRGPEDNAALHAYIDRSATAADTYLEYVGASGYVHYTLLRLSLALADARTIQTLLDRADPWLLLPPKRRALGEARFSVPGKAVSSTAAIIVRSAAPADGHFELIFSTRLGPRGVVLRLNEIRVTEDGSSGNAAWQFEVQANGQPAFTVRSRDYNDGRVPVVFGVSEPVEATVAIGAGQTILVTVRASRT